MNLQDKNSQERKEFMDIVKKYKNDINDVNFRDLILEVLQKFGTQGVQELRNMLKAINQTRNFDLAVLDIIAELTGLNVK